MDTDTVSFSIGLYDSAGSGTFFPFINGGAQGSLAAGQSFSLATFFDGAGTVVGSVSGDGATVTYTAGTGIAIVGGVIANTDRGSTAITTHTAAYNHANIGKVMAGEDDSAPATLIDTLKAGGDNVTISEVTDGGKRKVQIAVDGSGSGDMLASEYATGIVHSPTSFIVSGAGESTVNGVYSQHGTDTFQGRPVYTINGSGVAPFLYFVKMGIYTNPDFEMWGISSVIPASPGEGTRYNNNGNIYADNPIVGQWQFYDEYNTDTGLAYSAPAPLVVAAGVVDHALLADIADIAGAVAWDNVTGGPFMPTTQLPDIDGHLTTLVTLNDFQHLAGKRYIVGSGLPIPFDTQVNAIVSGGAWSYLDSAQDSGHGGLIDLGNTNATVTLTGASTMVDHGGTSDYRYTVTMPSGAAGVNGVTIDYTGLTPGTSYCLYIDHDYPLTIHLTINGVQRDVSDHTSDPSSYIGTASFFTAGPGVTSLHLECVNDAGQRCDIDSIFLTACVLTFTAPVKGMFAYLKDSAAEYFYDGSAWVPLVEPLLKINWNNIWDKPTVILQDSTVTQASVDQITNQSITRLHSHPLDKLITPGGTYPGTAQYINTLILKDGRVFMSPASGYPAAIYNPVTDTVTFTGPAPSNGSYSGGVLLNDGRVYFVPHTGNTAVIYDPDTNTYTTLSGIYPGDPPDEGNFGDGILLKDGCVFCVPLYSTKAAIYNPTTDQVVALPHTYPGVANVYGAALLNDGRVYMAPYGSGTTARIYDPIANTLTTPNGTFPGLIQNSSAFGWPVLLNDGRVFIIPMYSTTARIYDPVANTLTTPGGTYPGNGSLSRGVLMRDGRVYCVPAYGSYAYIYDPVADTVTQVNDYYYQVGNTDGSGRVDQEGFLGGVLMNDGRVFVMPCYSTTARIYDPGVITGAAGLSQSAADARYLQQSQNLADLDDVAAARDNLGLATVATTGSYADLTSKPTIPAAQVQSDWNEADSGAADYIKNKPTLGTASTHASTDFATASDVATLIAKVSASNPDPVIKRISTTPASATAGDRFLAINPDPAGALAGNSNRIVVANSAFTSQDFYENFDLGQGEWSFGAGASIINTDSHSGEGHCLAIPGGQNCSIVVPYTTQSVDKSINVSYWIKHERVTVYCSIDQTVVYSEESIVGGETGWVNYSSLATIPAGTSGNLTIHVDMYPGDQTAYIDDISITGLPISGTISITTDAAPLIGSQLFISDEGIYYTFNGAAWVISGSLEAAIPGLTASVNDLNQLASVILGTASTHSAADFATASAVATVESTANAAVPATRQISGHALTADIVLTAADVGLPNVTNDLQLKASHLSTNTALGTDDTLVPSQNAVKTYVDAHAGSGGSIYNNAPPIDPFGFNALGATFYQVADGTTYAVGTSFGFYSATQTANSGPSQLEVWKCAPGSTTWTRIGNPFGNIGYGFGNSGSGCVLSVKVDPITGNIGVIWTGMNATSPTIGLVFFSLYTVGSGWGAPELVSSSGTGCFIPALAVDTSGNWHVAYSFNVINVIYRKRTAGVWGTAATVITGTRGMSSSGVIFLKVNASTGYPYIICENPVSSTSNKITRAVFNGTTWTTYDSTVASYPIGVVVDSADNATVLSTGGVWLTQLAATNAWTNQTTVTAIAPLQVAIDAAGNTYFSNQNPHALTMTPSNSSLLSIIQKSGASVTNCKKFGAPGSTIAAAFVTCAALPAVPIMAVLSAGGNLALNPIATGG
jgi:hypothetical protein